MKCEHCHEDKDDVRLVRNPYAYELYGEEIFQDLCEACLDQLYEDI